MQSKNSVKGFIFLITAAVVWGFAFVAQAIGAGSITPFYFNFARYVLGALSLIPVILIFEKKSPDSAEHKKKLKITVLSGLIAGVILFTASYLQQVGILLTDSAGKSGFITGLYMILVPIVGIFLGKKTRLSTWIGAVFGVVGLFLICMSGGQLTITTGDLFLLLCAILFAFHILVIDHFGQRIYSLRFACTQFSVSALFNLVGTLIFEEIAFEPIKIALIPILYCGLASVGIAYTCQILGQKYSEPTSASIVLSTEAVFSAIGGALILNERMQLSGYIGCLLILCGILLSQLPISLPKRFSNKKAAKKL